jgi:hypothetical protein
MTLDQYALMLARRLNVSICASIASEAVIFRRGDNHSLVTVVPRLSLAHDGPEQATAVPALEQAI